MAFKEDIISELGDDRPVEVYASLPSTNARAKEWAREGASDGGLVLADAQTAGRGRQGRGWESEPGRNLTFSVILRPDLQHSHAGLVSLATGLALTDILKWHFTLEEPVRLKWPNDVLIGGRKSAGILVESEWNSAAEVPEWVVVGIGLNVNQRTFPSNLRFAATSLARELGRDVDRPMLLSKVVPAVERRIGELRAESSRSQLMADFHERLWKYNEPISVNDQSGGKLRGINRGVNEEGALRLETPSGEQFVYAGDVSIHHSPPKPVDN